MSSVTYTLRKIDILEFNEHYAKMNGAYGKSIMRHQIIWPAVISVMALYIVMTSEDTQLGLLLLSCAFAWSLLVPAWIKKRFHQYILEQLSEEDIPTETGEYTLKVTDKGLMEIKPNSEDLIAWTRFNKFEQTKHHAYLYMSEASAIIIPKKTLSEDSDYEGFHTGLIEALKSKETSGS